MMTINDRNKYAFVTICYGLLSLLLSTTTITTVAASASAPFEASVQPQAASGATASATTTTTTTQQDEVNAMPGAATVRAFSPRMDYNNEWRPLGHGDPLKNDPTYDYSPPALERVRYWAADNGSGASGSSGGGAVDKNANKEQNKTKSEILLLGVSSERERMRGQQQLQQQQHNHHQHEQIHVSQHKNGVGVVKSNESPLLQPKYTSIRRSYYAQQPHQMPHTHLMPPPMYQAAMTALPTPPQQIMKNSAPSIEHRHHNNNNNMLGNYMTGTSTAGHQHMMMSSMHSKPYYSTAATSPWLHHSTPHMAHVSDAQHLESMQHYSFTRPSMAASGHGGMATTQVIHSYSPNAIHTYGQAGNKQSAAPRKPWLHELLQKELVKPTKHQSSRPHYDGMTPSYGGGSGMSGGGISTTYAPFTYTPVTFVSAPPTIATKATTTTSTQTVSTGTQGAVYITPTPHTTPAPPSQYTSETGFRPMIMSSPPPPTTSSPLAQTMSSMPTPTYTPPPATTTNSRLLIIPTMSNLAYRPTVAPLELTTDALFKHYKQPKKPIAGPMYLIIEGHSKVKTYGQNELDPHQPKIVPIIPKREPVIRIADPNEKRGTVETFQVKHLHTTSTTPMPTTSTTTVSPTTTTTPTPKIVQPTIITTRATMTQPAEHAAIAEGGGFASTGIQSVLSLLDIFTDNAMANESGPASQPQPIPTQTPIPKLFVKPATTTVLRPVTTAKPKTETTIIKQAVKPQQPEPRISSKAGAISSILADKDDEDNEGAGALASTEEPPRGTRQIFDYDQLPESRLKELPVDDDDDEVYDYVAEDVHNDDAEDATSVEDPTAEGYAADESHKLLKRIDSFLDDVDEEDDDDDNNDDDNVDEAELAESNELDDLADLAEGFEDATT